MSDELRDRLGELADEGAAPLSEEARDRVLEAVRWEGPTAVRKGRTRRYLGAGAGVLAVAAAAALAVFAGQTGTDPSSDGAALAATPRACESWTPASAEERDGLLDLGPRGAVTVAGVARVEAEDPCTTLIILGDGRVDVRADDLGGGVLRVEAGPVRVEVRGTVFSVAREGAGVAVAVTEGHVVVANSRDREIHLRAGERWSRGRGLATAELGAGAAREHGDTEGGPETPVIADADDTQGRAASPGAGSEVTSVARRGPRSGAGTAGTEGQGPGDGPGGDDGAAAVLARAEGLWRDGDRSAAARLFREVGGRTGAVAEAAWVRLARLELRSGDPRGALNALRAYQRRFPRGRLGAESLWLEVEAHRQRGDEAAAAGARTRLLSRYPSSPQARAAAPPPGPGEGEE